jgi:hypothetical protein
MRDSLPLRKRCMETQGGENMLLIQIMHINQRIQAKLYQNESLNDFIDRVSKLFSQEYPFTLGHSLFGSGINSA